MSGSVPFALLSGPPGVGEYILLFLVILVLFGPKRLPGIVRTFGRIISDLRRASQEFRDEIMKIEETLPGDASSDASIPAEWTEEEAEDADHDNGSDGTEDHAGEDGHRDLAG